VKYRQIIGEAVAELELAVVSQFGADVQESSDMVAPVSKSNAVIVARTKDSVDGYI